MIIDIDLWNNLNRKTQLLKNFTQLTGISPRWKIIDVIENYRPIFSKPPYINRFYLDIYADMFYVDLSTRHIDIHVTHKIMHGIFLQCTGRDRSIQNFACHFHLRSVSKSGNSFHNRIYARCYRESVRSGAPSIYSQIAKFMRATWDPPGSCRPRWAPRWPHEPCYQGS